MEVLIMIPYWPQMYSNVSERKKQKLFHSILRIFWIWKKGQKMMLKITWFSFLHLRLLANHYSAKVDLLLAFHLY